MNLIELKQTILDRLQGYRDSLLEERPLDCDAEWKQFKSLIVQVEGLLIDNPYVSAADWKIRERDFCSVITEANDWILYLGDGGYSRIYLALEGLSHEGPVLSLTSESTDRVKERWYSQQQ